MSGWGEHNRPKGWGAPWYMQVAHIASGQGTAMRVDDARAVIVLCPLVHDLHVSSSKRFPSKVINRVTYPTIDEQNTLWVKKEMGGYDEEFLKQIWVGELPEPVKPHDYWCEIFTSNLGIVR